MSTSISISVVWIILILLCGCDAVGSKEPHIVGQIGYVDANGILSVMDTASRQTAQLAADVGSQYRWSPDGRKVAYVGLYSHFEAHQVFVMDADGSNRRVVTLWERSGSLEPHLAGGQSPVWSPDGKRIAFTRCINCEFGGFNTEVFIIDVDTANGLNEIQLTNSSYPDQVLDWSPDGSRILFQSGTSTDGSQDKYGDIYEMNVDGSGKVRVLLSDSTFGRSRARYSPDGRHIAFIGGSTSNEIYISDQDGSNLRRVTDNTLEEMNVSWSPDGDWVTFLAERERSGYGHIYVIHSNGKNQHSLTSGPAKFGLPEWRPASD